MGLSLKHSLHAWVILLLSWVWVVSRKLQCSWKLEHPVASLKLLLPVLVTTVSLSPPLSLIVNKGWSPYGLGSSIFSKTTIILELAESLSESQRGFMFSWPSRTHRFLSAIHWKFSKLRTICLAGLPSEADKSGFVFPIFQPRKPWIWEGLALDCLGLLLWTVFHVNFSWCSCHL